MLESIQLTSSILIFKEDVRHVGNERINNTKNYSNYMQFAIYMQGSPVDKWGVKEVLNQAALVIQLTPCLHIF